MGQVACAGRRWKVGRLEGWKVGRLEGVLVRRRVQVPGGIGRLEGVLASGAERVSLGDEAAGGVDDVLSTVGSVAALDQVAALALRAEAKRLVSGAVRAV